MKRKLKVIFASLTALVLILAALVVGVMASESAPTLEINGANVSFEGTVHLWYSVGYKNIDNPDDIKLLVWREDSVTNIKNCTLGTEDTVLTNSGDVNEQGIVGKAFDYEGLTAAQMTENVYVRAYVDVDGETVYSPVVKYSIVLYSLNKLGVTGTISPDANLRAMLKEMLEYGAAAQTYFAKDGVVDGPLATDSFVKIKTKGAAKYADGTTSSLVKLGDRVTLYAEPTAELPYVIWTNESGKQVGSGSTFTVKAQSNSTYTATLTDEATSFGAYDRVVFIGIDGAGGSLIQAANTPNIDRIFAGGATTYNMLTVPSVSAHSWSSILHGVETEDHGVLSNEQVETGSVFNKDSKYPSFLRVVRESNPDSKVASIASWGGINVGIVEDDCGIYKYKNGDANGALETVRYINDNTDFELIYVHFNDPDAAGHNSGYGGTQYNSTLERIDGYIGDIYDTLEDNGLLEGTLFIVTTDHGGTAKGHGGMTAQETEVFFGAAGYTVNDGTIVDMENRDCAAVVLYALGYEQPETYTARVPSGLFEGVEATERTTYYDKDNHRDIEAPGVTPDEDDDSYITNFIDKPLYVYMPFDGNASDQFGNKTTEIGSVEYIDGYYGGAAKLDGGSVELSNINPNVQSFTISMMVKIPHAHRLSPILASTSWNEANYKNTGFVFAVDGDTYPNEALFNVGFTDSNNTSKSYSGMVKEDMPSDFNRGWMHVTLIVDRAANEIKMCFDFGEVYTATLPEEMRTLSFTSTQHDLAIGDNTQSAAPHKISLTVDEFMIFNGAFDTNDINSLAEYFGKEPKHEAIEEEAGPRDHENVDTPEIGSGSHLADIDSDLFAKLDYYFPFDKTADNRAASGKEVVTVGNLTYATNGYFGEALKMREVKSYIQLPGASYGKNSFTVGFWVNTGTLLGSTIPILSSQRIATGSSSKGFTLFMNAGNESVSFYLSNGSTRYTQSVAFPEDYKDGWTYVLFSMDREAKQWKISYDFGEFTTGSLASNDYSVEGADGDVWTIGQDTEGKYWTALLPMIDELMIFNGTLDRHEIKSLARYFGKTVPGSVTLEEYLNSNDPSFDKDIMLDLDFNGDVYNNGSQKTDISTGEMVYTDSPFGTAASFTGNAYDTKLPDNYLASEDFKLSESQAGGGYSSFSFSFWLKLDESSIGVSDRMIFSTTDIGSSDYVPGMAIVLYGAPEKIKESALPSYANKDDYIYDSEGYAMYKSTGEYVYRQRLQLRATSSVVDPSSSSGAYYFDRQSVFIYASMSEWSHLVIVYDRGQYGVDDGEYRVYMNGTRLSGVDKWNTLKMSNIIEDQADLNGAGLMINDDVNHYPRAIKSHLDEFVIFEGALTEEEIALIAAYYESIRDTE